MDYTVNMASLRCIITNKTVGVMGDTRTYENICLLRAVTSEDGMTADYFSFPKIFRMLQIKL